MRRSAELLDSVSIPNPSRQLDAYPHQLSGGMRQRVMIAMGLSREPKILIADEPTTALDVSVQAQILELLRTMTAAHRTSLLMISHDLSVVAGMADRIAVMYAGQLVETGPTAQIFDHPRHPYTEGLLECIPRLDRPRTSRLRSIDGSLPDPHQHAPGCPFAPRCRLVLDHCWTEMPPLEEKAPGHDASCWADMSHRGSRLASPSGRWTRAGRRTRRRRGFCRCGSWWRPRSRGSTGIRSSPSRSPAGRAA
jgi:oligopeptide transport system ATP-binding protein